MTEGNLLRDAVVYLGAAVVLVPLFTKLRLGAVLGYLAAGILIGPSLLGLVGNAAETLHFAEFGVVLLLFVIGLELQPSRLWALRRDIFGLGAAQVVVCGLALTALLLGMTGLSWQAALVVGLPLGLSSTALVMQLLGERQLAATPFGERSFAMLLFQDLAIVPLLTIVAALSRAPVANPEPGWLMAAKTIGALAFLVAVGRWVLPRLFRIIGALGAREAFVAAALFCVLGSAWLMASLNLSMALGAFVAGVMLAESPYRHALETDIEPFRGLMLGLFFIAIGMSLDLAVMWANLPLLLALVAGVMAVKSLCIAVLARAFGTDWPRSAEMGLLLAQGGEFGFVLFAEAERGLLISHSAAQLFGAVVTCSMALTPLIFRLAARLIERPEAAGTRDGPETAGTSERGGHVVLVGAGRVGQVVTQMLRARGVAITAIDLDAELIDVTARFGNTVFWGDGTRLDILRSAGIEGAAALVLAMDGQWNAPAVLAPIRNEWPQLPIIARAFDRTHAISLRQAGVEDVVRETWDSAIALGRRVLTTLDTPDEVITAIEAEYRRRDLERLDLQIVTGDMMTGADIIIRSAIDVTSAPDPAALGEIPPA
jgi:monovalent cation:proton antiporter-2 (CPA2) family protein